MVVEAVGASSLLSLPELTTISATSALLPTEVEALSGGDIELPLLTQVSGVVQLQSTGSGSVLNLSGLASLTGIGGSQFLTITQGGSVTAPILATFANVSITTDTTATFALPPGVTSSFPSGTTKIDTGTVLAQGPVNIQGSAILQISGGLTLNGQGALAMAANSTLNLSGNLLGNTTSASSFNPLGTVSLDSGTGTGKPPQLLEAMSEDMGSVTAGYSNNFAYGTLKLATGTYAELIDESANAPALCPMQFTLTRWLYLLERP